MAKNLRVVGFEQSGIDMSIVKASVKASASKNSAVVIVVLGFIGSYVNNELKKVLK